MRYKKFNMPIEAYDNFKRKQTRMNLELKNLLGRSRNIPLTRLVTAVSQKMVTIDDKELISLANHRRKKK